MHAEMLKVNNHFSNLELQFELKLRTYIVSFLIKVGKYNKFSIGFTKHERFAVVVKQETSKIKV